MLHTSGNITEVKHLRMTDADQFGFPDFAYQFNHFLSELLDFSASIFSKMKTFPCETLNKIFFQNSLNSTHK